ncbi:MAG: saccharopine dehydrogenase C-terminal domain-containing protein [Gallionellaceae bacterium]|jgi:homospermidine synthase
MNIQKKHANFSGRLLMVGFGSIGQAVLPLLFRHLVLDAQQIKIIAADRHGADIADGFGVAFSQHTLSRTNYMTVLEPFLDKGDFLLNLSVDVSSLALIELCHQRGALYLDTCIEPWPGGYTDSAIPVSQRSNYALREEVLAYGRSHAAGPTALVTHGANPGLASAFVKQALLDIATESAVPVQPPARQEEWARLACQLGIRTIHISERDTQTTARRKQRGEFINTWSVDAFISEGLQPSELGWGTHERHWPVDAARHENGCGAAIYLNRPGASTRVRSWTPLEGAFHGFLITHGESISIADHLTLREKGVVSYRPTVNYAYHPCDDAVLSIHEIAGKLWQPQLKRRIIRDEIEVGIDELGVLLMGSDKGVYWYGSRLSIGQARKLAPYNNATSMQVAAGVLAGMVWALRNPAAGVVEPDDIDHVLVLEIAKPYLGEMVGIYDEWTPLRDRDWPFREELDRDDPWQFRNMRVG